MGWQDQVKGSSLSWLLEPDSPGVRYLALRDLLDAPQDSPDLLEARRLAHEQGPIAPILAEMNEAGYWVRPGPGYNPKYRGTVWSLIALSQLGAHVDSDERIRQACTYLMGHALIEGGLFSERSDPSGTIDCLQGNLCAALLDLGFDDLRLEKAFDWMARSVTGEGVAPTTDPHAPVRYYAGKCGPNFACRYNNKLPCAWGGVKVMLALGKLPTEQRTPLIERAIEQGAEFLLSVDPAGAAYPTRRNTKPSENWWKFSFPVFYVTDILQIVESLASSGYGQDPRLAGALKLIRDKQDDQGRWALDYGYSGKTWVDFGEKKQANKWVTLRALRVLKKTNNT